MKRTAFLSLALSTLTGLLTLAINVQLDDLYQATGIRLKDGATKVEVGKTVDAIVTSPDKLSKLGFPDTKVGMELKLTFKSELLVETVFPSLKKKASFARVQGKWELQAIMSI